MVRCLLELVLMHLSCNVELFADDTTLFFIIHDINVSAEELNEDLKKNQRSGFSMENYF